MGNIETTRRNFVKGAVVGTVCATGLGTAGIAAADEVEIAEEDKDPDPSTLADDIPDTYTHATDTSSKQVLEGEQFEAALQYLADSSHYLYINRATPYYGN